MEILSECERVWACVSECERMWVSACVSQCVYECEKMWESVCVCVEMEGKHWNVERIKAKIANLLLVETSFLGFNFETI